MLGIIANVIIAFIVFCVLIASIVWIVSDAIDRNSIVKHHNYNNKLRAKRLQELEKQKADEQEA